MKPQNLPRRDPSIPVEKLAFEKMQEVELLPDGRIRQVSQTTSLALCARLIEGHPEDVEPLAKALHNPIVRAGLIQDLELDQSLITSIEDEDRTSEIIGDAAVKVLSALYAAGARDFAGFLILTFPPISTHRALFVDANRRDAHAALHAKDPDIEAIIARPWQLAFHGHQHAPLGARLGVHARRLFG
jgi:hypothetical protein